jgi:tRNA1(Val) A37 N6-methylase TrmN6
LNIVKGDFLAESTHKKLLKLLCGNELKFDLVMGNPPYQPQSDEKKGGKSLWTDFVIRSLTLLKDNKYLLFIHPALWRKPENMMRTYLFTKQLCNIMTYKQNWKNK